MKDSRYHFFKATFFMYYVDMEKDARSAHAASANFSPLCKFLFFLAFRKILFAFFVQFLEFLSNFARF